MSKAVRFGVAVLLVAVGLTLAVLMRDTSCTASLPQRCSRSVGFPSTVVATLGVLVTGAWILATRRK